MCVCMYWLVTALNNTLVTVALTHPGFNLAPPPTIEELADALAPIIVRPTPARDPHVAEKFAA